MSKSRGNKTTKAEREDREQRIAQELARGTSRKDLQEKLQIRSRTTLWRSIRSLQRQSLLSLDPDDVRAARQAQGRVLLKIEEALVSGKLPPDVVTAWTKLRESMARLLGLNAPTKSVHAVVSNKPDLSKHPRFWKFQGATVDLNEFQFEEVLRFAKSLPRLSKEVDASWITDHFTKQPQLTEGENHADSKSPNSD